MVSRTIPVQPIQVFRSLCKVHVAAAVVVQPAMPLRGGRRQIARVFAQLAETYKPINDAKRNRVYCAQALLAILEELAHLTPTESL